MNSNPTSPRYRRGTATGLPVRASPHTSWRKRLVGADTNSVPAPLAMFLFLFTAASFFFLGQQFARPAAIEYEQIVSPKVKSEESRSDLAYGEGLTASETNNWNRTNPFDAELEDSSNDNRLEATARKFKESESNGEGKRSFQGCDLYSGRWGYDEKWPVYSGKRCKWVSQMFVCRLGKKSSFQYEKYRWRPTGCSSPPYDGKRFLEILGNKTLMIIGDSLGHQQFESLLCTLDPEPSSNIVTRDIGKQFGFHILPGQRRPTGYAIHFVDANVTIGYYSTHTLNKVEPTGLNATPGSRPMMAFHLDSVHPMVMKFVGISDILVLNTGHHWNGGKKKTNGWILYKESAPITFRHSNGTLVKDTMTLAKSILLNHTIQWIDTQIKAKPSHRPLVFLRTMSPRHFVNGEWDSGGTCDFDEMITPTSSKEDVLASLAVQDSQISLLNITHLSDYRGEAHIGRWNFFKRKNWMDCLHWCLPGVPDTWNEILYWEILKRQRYENNLPFLGF